MFPDSRGAYINIWGIPDPKSGYTSDKDRKRNKEVKRLHNKSDEQKKTQKKLEILGDKILPNNCFKNWAKKILYYSAAVYSQKSTNTLRSIPGNTPISLYSPLFDEDFGGRATLLTKAGKANKIVRKCTKYFSGEAFFLSSGYGPYPDEVKKLNKNRAHGEVVLKKAKDSRDFYKQTNEQDDAAQMIINTLKTLHKYKLPSSSIAPNTMNRCLEKMRKYITGRHHIVEIEELYSKLT